MSPVPTLPGTLRGLLRGQSRVLHADLGAGIVWQCDCTAPPHDRPAFPVFFGASSARQMDEREIDLDLSDATSRVHATWWALALCPHDGWYELHAGARLWLDPHISAQERTVLWRVLHHSARILCWLHDLDPDDPRTLPDGSRWVDAEALRRVCLCVEAERDAAQGYCTFPGCLRRAADGGQGAGEALCARHQFAECPPARPGEQGCSVPGCGRLADDLGWWRGDPLCTHHWLDDGPGVLP